MVRPATPAGIHSTYFNAYTSPFLEKPSEVELSKAISKGDLKEVRKLLDSGAPRNRFGPCNLTPVEQAMKEPADLEMVELLLEYHAPIDETTLEAKELLHRAVVEQKPNLVRLLLEHEVTPNVLDSYGRHLMYFALEGESIEIVQLLLQHGVSPDVDYTSYGEEDGKEYYRSSFPLLHAVNIVKPDMARLLINYGASVNKLDKDKLWTPLLLAIHFYNQEMVKLLLQHDAMTNLHNKEFESPLKQAMKEPFHLEIIELLLEHDAPIDERTMKAKKLLFRAVEKQKPNLVRLLLKHQVDPNLKDAYGRPLISFALEGESKEIVELLLQHGANPDVEYFYFGEEDGKRYSLSAFPLLHAAIIDKPDMAKLLIDYKADVNKLNKSKQWTPLLQAVNSNSQEMVKLLLQQGAKSDLHHETTPSPLQEAMREPISIEIIELLLNYGAPFDQTTMEAKELLHKAVAEKKPNLVRLLLERQVDPNADGVENDQGDDEHPPIFFAIKGESIEIVKLLLQYGVNPNVEYADYDDHSYMDSFPLLQAVTLDNPQLVTFLLDKGADVNKLDQSGIWAPLQYAIDYKLQEIVDLLLEYGADINLHKGKVLPPIYYALLYEDLEMAEFLCEQGADIHVFSTIKVLLGKKKFKSAKFLLDKGFNIETKSPVGRTLLHQAANQGILGIAEFLCEHKANVDSQDNDGNTALHFAVMHSKLEIINLLMEHGARCDIENKKSERPEDLTQDETILTLFSDAKARAYKG